MASAFPWEGLGQQWWSRQIVDMRKRPVRAVCRRCLLVLEMLTTPSGNCPALCRINDQVGSLQPIKEIASACRKRGIMCHTDAAQSIGKVAVKVGLG